MNLLNAAAAMITSPLRPIAGSPIASYLSGQIGISGGALAVSARDSAISELSCDSTLVNGLQQFASSQTSEAGASAIDSALGAPGVPPMPSPKPAATGPADDHGRSNIVFSNTDSDSDADADAALIR